MPFGVGERYVGGVRRPAVKIAMGIAAVPAMFYGVLFIWLSLSWGFIAGIAGGALLTFLGVLAGVKAMRPRRAEVPFGRSWPEDGPAKPVR